MRRTALLVVSAGIAWIGFGLAGCGKPAAPAGNNGGGNHAPAPAPAGVTKANIVGNWVIDPADYADYGKVFVLRMLDGRGQPATEAEVAEGMTDVVPTIAERPPTFAFNQDGTFAIQVGENTGFEGTWTLEGDVVSIAPAGGMAPGNFRYSGGKMTSVLQVTGEPEATLIRKP